MNSCEGCYHLLLKIDYKMMQSVVKSQDFTMFLFSLDVSAAGMDGLDVHWLYGIT